MQLHDIFPAIQVVEYSMYWLLLYLMLGGIVLSLLWRYFRHRTRRGLSYYLLLLEDFDATHAKHVAYQFAYYGMRIVKTKTQKQRLDSIIAKLQPYKYLKDDVALPQTLANEVNNFLETIRRENV